MISVEFRMEIFKNHFNCNGSYFCFKNNTLKFAKLNLESELLSKIEFNDFDDLGAIKKESKPLNKMLENDQS